jgi:hypothetical protein
MSDVSERIQEEVTEIAEVLARRQGKVVREVWTEALTLHRIRYETKVFTVDQDSTFRRREEEEAS